MTVTDVIQEDVPIYSRWVGTTEGFVDALIHPKVSGYILKQVYQDGDHVRAGQLLFQIDPREYKAALDQALGDVSGKTADLRKNQEDLARYKPLLAAQVISRQDFAHVNQATRASAAAVEAAQAAVESARLNLEWTQVISPIDGVAGIAKAQVGDLVSPSTLLTTVSQLDPIKVTFPISEREYLRFAQKIKEHQEKGVARDEPDLEMILADGSIYPYRGHFYVANRQVNVQTGTIKIEGLFPNHDYILRPGLYAKIRSATGVLPRALLVPDRAILENPGSVPGGRGRCAQSRIPDRDKARRLVRHAARDRSGTHARPARGYRRCAEGQRRNAGQAWYPIRHRRARPPRLRRRNTEPMSKFFINRPIVAMVIAIFFVIAGAVMMFRLPIAQFPDIVPPQIQTRAVSTGADALTVEHVDHVLGAVDLLLDRSGDGLVFAMTSPNKTWDQDFLANYIAINITDELARIPGIGQARVFGASNPGPGPVRHSAAPQRWTEKTRGPDRRKARRSRPVQTRSRGGRRRLTANGRTFPCCPAQSALVAHVPCVSFLSSTDSLACGM